MKKILAFLLAFIMMFSLSGCALFELIHDKDNIVDLGNGEDFVKWVLVQNNNEYSTAKSAYFEFNKDSFKYYEDGVLKKEGTHRITYYGTENTISPLHLNLNFGNDSTGLSIFDYIDCYTEDTKDNLHQFTIMSEGYHIKPPRSGGVPVRDYHLSDMPYVFGTYVKEGTEQYTYKNGKANYLNCAKMDGTFIDEKGNKFYFANNSYSVNPESPSYTVYMRYENNVNNTFVEGTISVSCYEDFYTKEYHNIALIYVMHGKNEPSEEKGVSVYADIELMDFTLGDGFLSFADGKYFHDNEECGYDPNNFIAGTYHKIDAN
ncbi:MAG: hypothetical protein IJW76_05175 [Clostridia bacterium]|nr:hypothetical protein [Clostridia bacterium]